MRAEPQTANVRSAIALLEAFRLGDRTAIGSLLHPDARWWVLGRGFVPVDGLLDIICKMANSVRSRPMTIIGTTSEGDRVAVEAHGHITLADGTPYSNDYHFLFRFQDGRVIEGKEYLDTDLVRRTFGDAF